jgi:excisionase family DNA binding protein
MQTDFITTHEAAAILHRHPVYVAKQLREGKIPGYKCGQWKISKSELLAFIEAGSNQDNTRGTTAAVDAAERI